MYIGENSDLVSILLVSTIIIILVHNFPVLITLILIVKAELYKVLFKSWPEFPTINNALTCTILNNL